MLEKYFGVVHLLILNFFFLIIVGVVLLVILRLATWLNKKLPRRPEQRLSFVGIVIGGITGISASSVLVVPVVIYVQTKGSAAIASAIQSAGWLYWLQLAIGFVGSAVGGYVAAWMANHDELLNGLLSSFLCIGFALCSILLAKGTQSLLAQILVLATSPAFALIGGYVRQIQKSTSRTPGTV